MRWMVAISLVAMIGSHFADSGAARADCSKPTDLHDGWTVAAPEQEALDPALICGIGPRLEALKEAKRSRGRHRPPRAIGLRTLFYRE